MPPVSTSVGLSPPAEDDSRAIAVLAAALDQRDSYTGPHCNRGSQLAARLGRRCGLDPERQGQLALAARFHDAGKIGARDDVLLPPGRLDEDKISIMRSPRTRRTPVHCHRPRRRRSRRLAADHAPP